MKGKGRRGDGRGRCRKGECEERKEREDKYGDGREGGIRRQFGESAF